jgi:hypothetical protein
MLLLDGNNAEALLGVAVIRYGSSNAQEVSNFFCVLVV